MINISAEQIELIWEYETFIPKLRNAFQSDYVVPQRNHYDYKNGVGKTDSTLLIMPARSNKEYVGIKIVTVSPYNGELDLSSLQGIYTLINAKDGQVQAQIGAKAHTIKKTAATSALASSYLSGEDSKTIPMVGTGALCLKLGSIAVSDQLKRATRKHYLLTHQNFVKS